MKVVRTDKVRRIDHWPDEWLVGVAGMSWEEIGAYHVICDLIYSSGRSILSDDSRLVVFGGGHRNRVNSMITRLESLGKLSTNPVETSGKSAGKVLEISVTRCTIELENARNRIENKSESSKTNGLDSHARGHTHAHARDSNLQPSTINNQPPARASHAREESDSINGWKKAEVPRFKQPADYANVHNPLYGPQEDPHVLMARIEAREKAKREAATDRSQPASTVTASPSDASAVLSRKRPRQPRTRPDDQRPVVAGPLPAV